MRLESAIAEVAGLPRKMKIALGAIGIETVKDLIFYFPFRYDDFTRTTPVGSAPDDGAVTLVGAVIKVANRRSFRRRMQITEAIIDDGSGRITALWFHQPYLAKNLRIGGRYRFAGKVSLTKFGKRLVSPLYEPEEGRDGYAAPLVPVYSLPKGISQFTMRKALKACEPLMRTVPETLPDDVRERHGLVGAATAIPAMHFPTTIVERDAAWRRIAFEELYVFHLAMAASKRSRQQRRAPSVAFDEAATRAFVKGLPYALTGDQRRAAWDALKDMGRDVPMHRLLDGDVGSGKTVVAAIAALNAARAGYQVAVMAPTEILAGQHYATFRSLFGGSDPGKDITVALWTNAYKRSGMGDVEMSCVSKKEIGLLQASIGAGDVGVVIGTHALIEERLRFGSLALAVIDEQHRFGVRTRQLLCTKCGIPGAEPHLLSMTATPIPRSLALTFFGDLDLSLLAEKPAGRRPVATKVVPPSRQDEAYGAVRSEIAAGRQAFIICPLIDPSDALGAASVTEEIVRLADGPLAGISLDALHGKMTAAEKEKVMNDFVAGRLQALVSTSVIEVGVDVPNATVMCVLGAERFGLAQLHQFRGRIGRGAHASVCFLLPSTEEAAAGERLRAMTEIADGFKLADKDLSMRGPGDMLGEAQSGYPQFKVASLGDARLIKETKQAAERALEAMPASAPAGTRPVHLE